MKITYLNHSGFAVETEDIVMVFDCCDGNLPDTGGKKLYIFASHNHSDHYTETIFDFNADKYILSDDIPAGKRNNTVYVQPDEIYETDDITVETFKSTDEGVAFYVTCQGKTVYHAGDLHLWSWYEEGENYVEEMRKNFFAYTKKLRGRHVDIAFLPLDYRLGESGFEGMEAYINMFTADHIFPMHQWDRYDYTKKYIKERGHLPNLHTIEYRGQEFII